MDIPCNIAVNFSVSMDMRHGKVHIAYPWLCSCCMSMPMLQSMFILHVPVHAACSRPCCMSMSVLQVQRFVSVSRSMFSMDTAMQHGYGHAAWTRTCSTDMIMQHRHGHAAWTWTRSKYMDRQCGYGHTAWTRTRRMDLYILHVHVHAPWTWTRSMNLPFSMTYHNMSQWLTLRLSMLITKVPFFRLSLPSSMRTPINVHYDHYLCQWPVNTCIIMTTTRIHDLTPTAFVHDVNRMCPRWQLPLYMMITTCDHEDPL